MRMIFPSVTLGHERAYVPTGLSDLVWDTWYRNPQDYVSGFIGTYETYGDGMVQHSGTYAVPLSLWNDCLISLAAALLQPDTNLTVNLDVGQIDRKTVDFFLGITHREDKQQWYNPIDLKVSAAESRRNDRRWFEVPSWADGTMANAITLYFHNCQARLSMLKKAWVIDTFKQAYHAWSDPDIWPGKWAEHAALLPKGHGNCLHALRRAHTVAEERFHAQRLIDWAKRELSPAAAQAA